MNRLALLFSLLFTPLISFASEGADRLDLTGNWVGITSVLLFFVAYLVVMAEEFTHLRKSKPVMLAAGIIWGMTRGITSRTISRTWSRLRCATIWRNTPS